jgi:hypothetical protein
VAGRRARAYRENGQRHALGAARVGRLSGRLRKPIDDVLDGIRAISHLSSLARRGGALALLQSDFLSGNCVTIVTIGAQRVVVALARGRRPGGGHSPEVLHCPLGCGATCGRLLPKTAEGPPAVMGFARAVPPMTDDLRAQDRCGILMRLPIAIAVGKKPRSSCGLKVEAARVGEPRAIAWQMLRLWHEHCSVIPSSAMESCMLTRRNLLAAAALAAPALVAKT